MTQIILDAGLRGKLHNLKEPLEICDESGRVLAHLQPVLDQTQFEQVELHLSPDELQRRRQEPDFSTAEVLSYLEKL